MAKSASLRAFLERYAAGGVSREEMIRAVSAWPLEEPEFEPGHTLPTHQDNTIDVVAAAVLNGLISEDDYREILARQAR